eukprot:scaffold34137_cov21-Tisochrysis_lutea.AAC.6
MPPHKYPLTQRAAHLVLLHALGHHVQDVVHDRRAQLQVKVALNALLGHRLGNTLHIPEHGETLSNQPSSIAPWQRPAHPGAWRNHEQGDVKRCFLATPCTHLAA